MASIPQIQIRQQYAKVGIETTNAKVEIKQPKADIKIVQEHAFVEMSSTPLKIEIDQIEAWSALGKRPSMEFTKAVYNDVNRIVLEATARIAQEGDRLAKIHIKKNPIPDMAFTNSTKSLEINYEGMPANDNVRYNVILGELDYKINDGRVNIDVKPNMTIIDYTPGSVEIYLQQKNSIEIIPPQIDTKI